MAKPDVIYLDAHPNKRALVNLARSYSPDLALYEFIDNAVDTWRRNGKPGDLDVHLHFQFEGTNRKSLVIHDNGGGVPKERLQALVQVGAESHDRGGIGVWGSGLKIGAIALATHWTIETHFPGETARRIDWPASWWDETTWEPLKAEPLPQDAVEAGTFRITLHDINEPLSRSEVFGGEDAADPLIRRLGRVYAPLLSAEGGGVRIFLHDQDERPVQVKPDRFGDPKQFDDVFAAPPGFEPRKYHVTLERDAGLTVDLVVGLLPEQSRDLSGVTMYGKGRLFEQARKEGTVGFGTRGRAKIPASHPTTWRLAVLAYFDGPPDLIPWESPAKSGYRENNPYHKQIRSAIMDAALPYATFTKAAKRLDLLPYSTKWNELSEEERAVELQRFTRDKAAAGRIAKANPQILKPFSPPGLRVERAPDASVLEEKAAAHQRLATRAAAFLRKREPRDPEGVWSARRLQHDDLAAKEPRPEDPWSIKKSVSVTLPKATIDLIAQDGQRPIREWLEHAIDAAAGELDPIWRIPHHVHRGILQGVRSEILRLHPETDGVAVFGSVVRGDTDHASDIDILVLHPDRLQTQTSLQEHFQEYRYPPTQDRYTIQILVSKPEGIRARAAQPVTPDDEFQTMLQQAVWIHGDATNLLGGARAIEQ